MVMKPVLPRFEKKLIETVSLSATFDPKPYQAPLFFLFVATQYTKFHADFFFFNPQRLTPSSRPTILADRRAVALSPLYHHTESLAGDRNLLVFVRLYFLGL